MLVSVALSMSLHRWASLALFCWGGLAAAHTIDVEYLLTKSWEETAQDVLAEPFRSVGQKMFDKRLMQEEDFFF